MTNNTPDTTRRTLAEARRFSQWQRLMKSVNDAQEAKGWPGRYFSAREARDFGETYIGLPASYVDPSSTRTLAARRANFSAYFVVRQENEHSDGSLSVVYKLKAVYGDDLATVHTIADSGFGEDSVNPSAEWEERTALDFIRRTQHQAGGWGA